MTAESFLAGLLGILGLFVGAYAAFWLSDAIATWLGR